MTLELPVLLDQQGRKDPREFRVIQGLQDQLDQSDHRERQDSQDPMVPQVPKGLQVHLEIMETKDRPVNQVSREILDLTGSQDLTDRPDK